MNQKDRMIELLEQAGIIKKLPTDSMDKCAVALALEIVNARGEAPKEFDRYAFNLAITTLAKEIMNKKGEEHEEITEKHRTR